MPATNGTVSRCTRLWSAYLEAHGIAGATVLSGITGYGAHRAVHQKGLIGPPRDTPNALVVIDDEVRLRAALTTLRPMVAEGIVILTDVEVIPPASTGTL